MWSFIASVFIFTLLVAVFGLWQRRTRKTVAVAHDTVDQQITAAAEVAQRRHVERFGRASTDLQLRVLNGAGHGHVQPK